MKLYFSKGACSLVVRIVINEIGVKCEYVSVDLKAKKTESGEDYLKINPKGAVPAIEIEQGLLTENQVIQQYLADTHKNSKVLPQIPDFQRYRVLELLNFISTDIHKNFGPLFNPKFPEEAKKEIVIPLLIKKFEYMNKVLEGKEFLMGDHFTLPDAYFFVMLLWAHNNKLDLSSCKNFKAYFDRMKEHASVKKSLQEEGITA